MLRQKVEAIGPPGVRRQNYAADSAFRTAYPTNIAAKTRIRQIRWLRGRFLPGRAAITSPSSRVDTFSLDPEDTAFLMRHCTLARRMGRHFGNVADDGHGRTDNPDDST
jgi:hypothetical protein